jgi:hypothetical protein
MFMGFTARACSSMMGTRDRSIQTRRSRECKILCRSLDGTYLREVIR